MSENKSTSFWSSLPGLITALAGMITALAVLVTTLANMPSNSNSSKTPEPTQAATTGQASGTAAASPSAVAGDSAEPTATAKVTPTPAAARDILFFSSRTDPATGNPNPDLYALDPRTGAERRLTSDPEPDSDPAWSPDGTRIAYDSRRVTGKRDIWILEADGSYTSLTDDGRENAYPAWSPDGRRIAWSTGVRGAREIWVMDASDGSNRRRLTSGGDDVRPNWGANGLIAFARKIGQQMEIWVVDPDDRARSPRISLADGGGFDPAWSPDARRLLFGRVVNGVPRIFVAAANGHSGLRQLTKVSMCDCVLPTWSPDGSQIAFEGPGSGNRPILVMSSNGGNARRVTTNGLAPRWGS